MHVSGRKAYKKINDDRFKMIVKVIDSIDSKVIRFKDDRFK